MYNAIVHNAIEDKSTEAEFMIIQFLIDYSHPNKTIHQNFSFFYIPFINCLAVPYMNVLYPAHIDSSLTVMDISMEV